MHALSPARRPAIAVLAGIFAVALGFSAFASEPITVTYAANNPWAQEIGSITRDANQVDYTVAVAAGKTLQINLVTRNPNLYFKVRNDAHRRWLTDTLKTGATTWSTPVAEAATFSIEVYSQQGAIGVGETAKFALQVGQYGQQDFQPATTTVAFADHNPWAQFTGTLDATGIAHDYTVAIAAGQTLAVNLITPNPKIHFSVTDQATRQALVDNATTGVDKWTTPVATAATYTVKVYIAAADVPPGKSVGYSLQIGQYAQTGAPAAATSAGGAPATAATAGGAATTH